MTKTLTPADPALTARADTAPTHPGRIVVEADFRAKDLIKAVPGARWDTEHRVWTLPLSWPSCLALRAELGASLTIGRDLMEWATTERGTKDLLRTLRLSTHLPDDLPADLALELRAATTAPGMSDLYPYQWVGALAIRIAHDYLVLDQQGTGKTRTALAGLRLAWAADPSIAGPTLIVCPKSMIGTWKTEILGFFPKAIVAKVTGTPTQVKTALEPGADFYVVNYEALRRYSRLAPFPTVTLTDTEAKNGLIQRLDLRAVIADEVHRAANPAAKQTRAVWQAMWGPKVAIRIGLTGTPIQDSPEQLWSPLHAITPYEVGAKTTWLNRFCMLHWNHWGGREVTGLDPFKQPEFEGNFWSRSRRITKDIALPFLPEKVFETRWVTLPTKHRKAYDSMQRELIAELEKGTVTASGVLDRAIRLVQLANASGEMTPDGKYRMALPSPKIDAFLEDYLNGDFPDSLAVFTDSRQLAELLLSELVRRDIKAVAITGAVTGADRDAAIEAFQSGEAKVIVFTRAGGEGVTLTAADTLVRLVRSWSYTVHSQVEDRVHRIGSEVHDSITIIDYLTERTVEEKQITRLMGKEATAQEVLRDADLLDMLKSSGTKTPALFGELPPPEPLPT